MTASDDAALEALPDDLLAALASPAFWAGEGAGGAPPPRVEHVQTHISHVFLVGDDVYKLKKAVRFAFLDFATRARRRFFCDEELRLNRRLAAPVYLDVVPVVRRADGTLALGGAGTEIEPLLHMRRLPADRLLPALLAAGAVDAGMMEALAARIARFHRDAPTGPAVAAHASPAALRARFADILASLRPFVGDVLHADAHATLAEAAEAFVATHEPLLRARQAEGRIREGHGDLHAEHVCFVGPERDPRARDLAAAGSAARHDAGREAAAARAASVDPGSATASRGELPAGIYVFDCIEFSEPFRCNDVASEVAFLTMDLEARGRRDLGDAFAAAYARIAGDAALAMLVPYYAAFRACVRATVAALTSAEQEVGAAEREAARRRAASYVALALRSAWRAGDRPLVVCCGLSGTGKSTLAAALAGATDAVVLRSDVLRKRHDPPPGTAPAPPAAERYTPAARAAVYAELARALDARLAAGEAVIADATFLRRADRDAIAAVARRHGRRLVFVETVADVETVRARMAGRTSADVSDARFDTYLAQRDAAEPWGDDEPRLTLATDGDADAVAARALRSLVAWRNRGAT